MYTFCVEKRSVFLVTPHNMVLKPILQESHGFCADHRLSPGESLVQVNDLLREGFVLRLVGGRGRIPVFLEEVFLGSEMIDRIVEQLGKVLPITSLPFPSFMASWKPLSSSTSFMC